MKYGKALISRGGSTTRIRAIAAVICANLRGTVRIKSVWAMAKIAGTKNRRLSAELWSRTECFQSLTVVLQPSHSCSITPFWGECKSSNGSPTQPTSSVQRSKTSRELTVVLYERKGLILHSWNSRGRVNISPASRHRTAHSSRLRYWSNLTMLPSHTVPDEVVITTTFGTSQGPTQPLIVSWTRFSSPLFRHSLFSHSTGTSGKPCSILPQQQPRQIVICPTTRRFVLSGQSRSSFTVCASGNRLIEQAIQVVHFKRFW
jgi:hypothetical protein